MAVPGWRHAVLAIVENVILSGLEWLQMIKKIILHNFTPFPKI